MKVKMLDTFNLPVKKSPGGMMPFLKDNQGAVVFVGDDHYVEAATIAINAYDVNQERIAELERAAIDVFNDIDFIEIMSMSQAVVKVWGFGQELQKGNRDGY